MSRIKQPDLFGDDQAQLFSDEPRPVYRTALEAARALDRGVREAGLAWDDLLRPDGEPEAGRAAAPGFAAPPAAPAPQPQPGIMTSMILSTGGAL